MFTAGDDFLLDILVLYWYQQRKQPKKRKRRQWVHEILRKRNEFGEYHRLVLELQLDGERFHQYFRMSREQFKMILYLVEGDIAKTDTQLRQSISARQRLAICIRFLATGNTYQSLSFNYRVSASAIGEIVPEVCQILWQKLQPIHMRMPQDQNDWKLIAKNFEVAWNFPHCIGAMDGKHIVIQAPANSGSQYFNYKGTFSVVLLAIADANLRFIYAEVGSYGRNSDGGIFGNSNFAKALGKKKLNLPEPENLPGDQENGPTPYCLIGDEAFPLMKNLMRPFPVGKKTVSEARLIYNYRLSRARRIVENTFGILATRWRIYHTKIMLQPEKVKWVVLATCVLHNLLQSTSTPAEVASITFNNNDSQGNLAQGPPVGNRWEDGAVQVREKFVKYFTGTGKVPWQTDYVKRGKFDA